MIRDTREQQAALESIAILHELDLGCHILFLMSDGSIDLLANDEQMPSLVENMLHLDSDETYRLFISLYEKFKEQQARLEEERATREQGRGSNPCNWENSMSSTSTTHATA